MGEGSGFALGPAFRYNTPRFDFKTSAAASTKTYFIGEASLRFPGTLGQDAYFKSEGPYIELQGRRRDFPQEDFFGLGPDSQLSDRSDFALRDTLGRVIGGYERGRLQTGIGLGYLDVSIGTGTDARMPSSTEIFTIDEMPGVERPGRISGDRAVCRVRFDRSLDRRSVPAALSSVGDRISGPQRHDRYSFRRWEADLRQYLTFVKDTRTIAFRAWAASATRRRQRGPLLSATDAGRGTNATRLSHVPLSGSDRAAVAG